MGYLDSKLINQILQHYQTQSTPAGSKPTDIKSAPKDDAILNKNTQTAQDEWDKYDISTNERPKTPENTNITGEQDKASGTTNPTTEEKTTTPANENGTPPATDAVPPATADTESQIKAETGESQNEKTTTHANENETAPTTDAVPPATADTESQIKAETGESQNEKTTTHANENETAPTTDAVPPATANTESQIKAEPASSQKKRTTTHAKTGSSKRASSTTPPTTTSKSVSKNGSTEKSTNTKAKTSTPTDNTPASQRLAINPVKHNAKLYAKQIKSQIDGASINANTRKLLGEKVKNHNVAYILQEYPNLVEKIDDEWGMDVKDVKKYVIDPLNNRLRELGLNKHCIPEDLSKLNMKQIQELCNKNAALIRKTDTDNGYVFKPAAKDEGKIHEPRKSSQASSFAGFAPKKAPAQKTANTTNSAKATGNTQPNQQSEQKAVLFPGEMQYPREMQDFILSERKKGIEYMVTKSGKEYTLTVDMIRSTQSGFSTNGFSTPKSFDFNATKQNNTFLKPPVKFKVDVPFNVTDKLGELKNSGATMEKSRNDGSYTITQTKNLPDGVTGITHKYNADGVFLYQINKNADGSETIGTLNSKTKKMEFKPFRNSSGTLQTVPAKISNRANEINQDGGYCRIIYGKNTFTIEQTKGVYLTENGLSKVEYKYNPHGVLLEQVHTYENGRVEKYLDTATKGNDAAHIPNPISMRLPKQYQGKDSSGIQMIHGLNTKGAKDTAQRFSGAIADSKANLMKSLRLTNEEYDNLAVIAMGIAEQETHFGQTTYVDTKDGEHTQWIPLKDRATRKQVANKVLWSKDEQAHHSQGITQINYSNAIKDAAIKKAFVANGIKSFDDLLSSPEKQAIATMIMLKQNMSIAKSDTWQARLKKNNAKISDPDKRLTTNDVIALLWNGAGGVVKRMDSGETITIDSGRRKVDGKDLNGAFYAKAVRAYSKTFYASPATEKSGAQHLTNTDNVAGAQGATGQNNIGFIGEVIFSSGSKNPSLINTAAQFINQNTKLSASNKTLLLSYINGGLVSFGGKGGLTKDEALSITNNDVALIKAQVDAIKSGSITATQATAEFEKNYLSSREFTVSNRSVNSANILSSTRSVNPRDSKITAGTLNFDINPSFYAGKERHTARYINGDGNKFAVTRSQGVNPHLANGQTVPERYRIAAEYAEYTATELFESGGKCKTGIAVDIEYSMGIDHRKIRGKAGRSLPHAKQLTEFYSAHPEVFTAVKYVDNGDGTSRELNATDVHNLPCGYFGVFTPGEGFEDESGHAFVSDGFGGAFADEHDNGKWAHFGNGKGEHGKLNVYGLSNSVVPVYSEKLGRKVNVPLNINPWYLTPEFRVLQEQECKRRGIPVPEYKEEFPI